MGAVREERAMGIRAAAAAVLVAGILSGGGAVAGDGETPPAPGRPAPAKEPGKKEPARKEPERKAPPAAEAAKPDRPVPAPRTVAEALALLGRMTVSVSWERTPLPDAVAHLAAITGMNIVVGPALLADGAADAILVDLRVRGVSARQALALAVDGRDLGLRMQGTVLLVTTKKDARGKPILRLHSIGDLLQPIRDFPGPDLLLRPAGSEPRVEEPKETKHPFGDGDDLVEMVKTHTGTGTWEEDGISVSVAGDWLVVRQYADVQGEVGRLLALLRSAR
jgi:hypothetical protein